MKLIKAIYLAMALSVAPAGVMMAQHTSGHFMHTVTKGYLPMGRSVPRNRAPEIITNTGTGQRTRAS